MKGEGTRLRFVQIGRPLAHNQILTLRGKVKDKDGQENGLTVPLCLALWAKVSEDVDQKLEAQQKTGALAASRASGLGQWGHSMGGSRNRAGRTVAEAERQAAGGLGRQDESF